MEIPMTARTTRIPQRSVASFWGPTMLAVAFGPLPTTVMTAPGPLGLDRVVGVTVVAV